MRVISGIAKGCKLYSPKGSEIRPALDRVKESTFNILGDIEGLTVLDLFAGTGSIGIEALSRGAGICVFVDSFPSAVSLIRRNLKKCVPGERGKIMRLGVMQAIPILYRRGQKFDLVFIDPPYGENWIPATLAKLTRFPIMKEEARLVIEHLTKESFETKPFVLTDTRKYGQSSVSWLTWRSAQGPLIHPL